MFLYDLSPKLVKLEISFPAEEEIATFILSYIGRRISNSTIIGGFINIEKKKLIIICSPRESVYIRNKVAELDENVIADILPFISVWGEGLGFSGIRED
jgi:uncharacterized membrane-anchored protein YitT (DUF2179 family)